VVPPLTLALGVSLADNARLWSTDSRFRIALVAAVVALLLLPAVLRLVAPGCDVALVGVVAMLLAIGALALTLVATPSGPESAFYVAIATRHLLFVTGGLFVLALGAAAARKVDLLVFYPYSLLAAALALTAVTALIGETVNGARLWLAFGPVRFQPSEIARLLLAAFIALYLYERRHLVAAPWRVGPLDLPPAPYLLPLGGAVLGAVAVLALQNDLGMAALVVLGAAAAIAAAVQSRALVSGVGLLLVLSAVGSFMIVPRVRERVAGWLDPWQDPAGAGFQFVRSDFALAAGGLAGRLAKAPAPSVPEVHTDLILTAVGSRLGWLGAAAVLALSGLLVCRCVLVGLRAKAGLHAALALSFAALLAIQIVLIAGGAIRALPLTGLTFPLLSYGGTSMLVSLFAIGIVLGLSAAESRR
jgi:cell division protein FtsW (lipid II flippase)